jgi:hypothetical protein
MLVNAFQEERSIIMIGKITVWQMTEDERLAYIAKYPIRPAEKPKGSTFANIQTDYKWQPERANEKSRERVGKINPK